MPSLGRGGKGPSVGSPGLGKGFIPSSDGNHWSILSRAMMSSNLCLKTGISLTLICYQYEAKIVLCSMKGNAVKLIIH